MTARCSLGSFAWGAVLGLISLGSTSSAWACPFCSAQGKSLYESVMEAGLVVEAKLSNAKIIPDAAEGQPDGTTEMTILEVIKDHEILGGKKKIVLPRYIPAAEKETVHYIVFAEVVDGKIDPYRGMPIESKDLVGYVIGSLKRGKEPPAERLGYFFGYLDHPDQTISSDAYREFGNAPYRDVAAAAKQYSPDRIAGWVSSKGTAPFRMGLYGLLLGVCGRASDAPLLRQLITESKDRPLTGLDGIMGGYCLLDPKQGPRLVLAMIQDEKNDFNVRYAALRTVRFILSDMPGVDPKMINEQLAKAIAAPDISDLIIDELRKNKSWSATGPILALWGNPKYDIQVVKRAVVRYALRSPDPVAAKFLEKTRAENSKFVQDVEEMLRYEEMQDSSKAGSTPPPVN